MIYYSIICVKFSFSCYICCILVFYKRYWVTFLGVSICQVEMIYPESMISYVLFFFVFQVNQVPCLLQVQPKTSNNMIFTLYRFESMFLYNSQTCPIVLPYLIRQACLKACNIAETSFVLFVDLSMVVFTVVWLVFHWHTTHIFISAFISHYVSRVSHSAVISMQDLLLYILT